MTEDRGNYADVDGLNLYYKMHGEGYPLVLLHGAAGAVEMLPLLAEGRRVIAVELQAHGRTTDIDRPLSFESMPASRLAVLPATTHYDIFSSPVLASAVSPFLDTPMPEDGQAAEGSE